MTVDRQADKKHCAAHFFGKTREKCISISKIIKKSDTLFLTPMSCITNPLARGSSNDARTDCDWS
jgi:hypothetical protein